MTSVEVRETDLIYSMNFTHSSVLQISMKFQTKTNWKLQPTMILKILFSRSRLNTSEWEYWLLIWCGLSLAGYHNVLTSGSIQPPTLKAPPPFKHITERWNCTCLDRSADNSNLISGVAQSGSIQPPTLAPCPPHTPGAREVALFGLVSRVSLISSVAQSRSENFHTVSILFT